MRSSVTLVLLLASFAVPAMAAERCAGPRWRAQEGLERLIYLGHEPETYRVCASNAGEKALSPRVPPTNGANPTFPQQVVR